LRVFPSLSYREGVVLCNDLLDPETGEQHTHALIHTIKTIDDANFVKVFAEGVKKAFELNRTEMRVFQKVLEIYEKEKMTGGYADSILSVLTTLSTD
jgi:hypothetical protein